MPKVWGTRRVLVRQLPERPAGNLFGETPNTTRGDAYAPRISRLQKKINQQFIDLLGLLML